LARYASRWRTRSRSSATCFSSGDRPFAILYGSANVAKGLNGYQERYTSGKKAGKHKPPSAWAKKSSSFRSKEAYAQAEMKARQSPEFKGQAAAGKEYINVRLTLREALGPDYLKHVDGHTKIGAPAGATRALNFKGGGVNARYELVDPKAKTYRLITLHPEGS
jgi:hypothetical protein